MACSNNRSKRTRDMACAWQCRPDRAAKSHSLLAHGMCAADMRKTHVDTLLSVTWHKMHGSMTTIVGPCVGASVEPVADDEAEFEGLFALRDSAMSTMARRRKAADGTSGRSAFLLFSILAPTSGNNTKNDSPFGVHFDFNVTDGTTAGMEYTNLWSST